MDGKRCSPGFLKHDQSKKIKTIPSIDEAILNLPEEIIEEILVRLPVKSLLKFRCVSKSWLSLISSSQFVKAHLTVSSNNSNYRVLITIGDPRFELEQCSLHSLMFDPSAVASVIDYPQKDPQTTVSVLCCCNGLVCIATDKMDIYIWNPSTRVSRKLPSVSVPVNFLNWLWGFGYDEMDDDYKILGIFREGGVLNRSIIVEIYSLKANSWKMITDFNGGGIPVDGAHFVNGKFHFLEIPSDTNVGLNIVSFDLNSEEYRIVEEPNYGYLDCFNRSLRVLGGCISVLCNDQKTRADLWVMKEYGIKESWTKVMTIPYKDYPENFIYWHPLCMLPNGDILLHYGSYFKIYNSKEKCLRSLWTCNLVSLMEVNVYVESLVSL